MDYAHAVDDGRLSDASLFFFHRQAGDEHDLTTLTGARAAVLEASGPAAAWRDIDGIMGLWDDPTTDRAYWERVWCNRLVKSASQAFDVERWKSLAKPRTGAAGRADYARVRRRQFHDATAIVATQVETGYQWVAGLWECPPGRDDWQVPAAEVDAVMRDCLIGSTCGGCMPIRRYWQSWIAAWAGAFGKERVIEWWTNRRRPMTTALENFHTAIREGTISHDGAQGFDAASGERATTRPVTRDEQGKAIWLIRKERPDSPHKIDLAMAAVLSWEARTDAIAAGVQTKAYMNTEAFGDRWR